MSEGRARLFVALELPAEVTAALKQWRKTVLGAMPGLRPVPAGAMHVTLCFLGSRAIEEVASIAAACAAVAQLAPPGLTLGEAIWLPPRRPRAVAVTIADARGELARVQGSLAATLHDAGWYELEERPFLPHVTVARVRRGVRVSVAELPAPDPIGLDGARLTLFRSHMERGGVRYEALSP